MMTFKKNHDDGMRKFSVLSFGAVFIFANEYYMRTPTVLSDVWSGTDIQETYNCVRLATGEMEHFDQDELIKPVKSCELTVEI